MTAPLSEQQLAEIAAREAAASKGPWLEGARRGNVPTLYRPLTSGDGVSTYPSVLFELTSVYGGPGDMAFIAAAREDVPALLAEVERLAARVTELEAEHPSRFAATPAEVDVYLRSILAEDTYLRYQQAIGSEAVREAMDDATAYRNCDDNASKKQAWRSGIDDALGYVDPDGDVGPYPSNLLCSQHNGFGPCPGYPWCTPSQDDTEPGDPS
ncbi:hypothetical protein OG552_10175 [Streptomyces sp. NBC_01476]|uniref:hypothetical protein n=1 Tax=Streptomyces sp. NBC_01476 TaxID=2903881 RepID=UPI002E376A70|nr:hypothetical protein [Streptomyces sp. NBC_01476]